MLGQRLKLGLAEKLAQLSAAIDERALSLDQFADELTADGLVEALKEALARGDVQVVRVPLDKTDTDAELKPPLN